MPTFKRKFRAILKLRRAFCPSAAMSCGGFGLLCDTEGRLIAVEEFPGNASDPSAAAA